jgi:hypothetical protein
MGRVQRSADFNGFQVEGQPLCDVSLIDVLFAEIF